MPVSLVSPRAVVMFDFDWTLCRPGKKQEFFNFVGLDYRAFSDAYKSSLAAKDGESLPARLGQAKFLVEEMAKGNLRTLDGRRGGFFTMESFAEFGRRITLFEGAEEALRNGRQRLLQAGVDPVFSINTRFYAPILEAMPIVADGTIDIVYGQGFKPSGAGVTIDGLLDERSKSVAVRSLMRRTDVSPGALLAFSDGYGDEDFLEAVRIQGGLAVGVLNPNAPDTAYINDLDRLRSFRKKDLVQEIVLNSFAQDGCTKDALERGLDKIIGRALSHEPEVAWGTSFDLACSQRQAGSLVP